MYRLSAEGNACRMASTTHEGTTLLFPRPSFPNLHIMYCLYPALRKLSMVKSNSSERKSHLAFIQTSRTSLSKQILENVFNCVMQLTLLQHTFSMSVSMGQQRRHLHHWRTVFPGGEGGFPAALSKFLAKSRLPRPIQSNSVRNWSFWLSSREVTNVCGR